MSDRSRIGLVPQRVSPYRIRPPGTVVSAIVGIVMSVLVLAPVAAVAWRLAVTANPLATIAQIVGGEAYRLAFLRSAIIGLSAAAASTFIATALAWLLHRTDLPARRQLDALVIVPFFIPLIVTALAWSLLSAEESGLINRALRELGIPLSLDIYSVLGIVFVMSVGLAPVAYFFVRDAVAEPATDQEEAAIVAGATPYVVTMRVTLPRILPTLGATFLVTLVLATANFSVPGVLGLSHRIDVLSSQIYVAMNSYPVNYARVAIVALTLVLLLIGLIILQQRLEHRARVTSQNVARGEPIVWQLGVWRWPCLVLVGLYFVVALVLPMFALFATSVLPFPGAPLEGFTLKNFVRVLDSPAFRTSMPNTLIFASAGATAAITIGSLAAYMFRRLRPPGAAVWDIVASAPVAMPGIVVGLGFLWIAVGSPLYGSLFLTTGVVVIRFLPFALRSGTAALTRVDKSLDEAARISGAGEAHVFASIVLPNIRASIISMWGLLFILFTHEVDTNVLLQGSDNGVLAVQIYDWYQHGALDLATAGAVILLLLTATVFAVMTLLLGGRAALGAMGRRAQ